MSKQKYKFRCPFCEYETDLEAKLDLHWRKDCREWHPADEKQQAEV